MCVRETVNSIFEYSNFLPTKIEHHFEHFTGIPRAILHQQQTTGSAGTGEVQEGQISRMSFPVPHREPLLQNQ